MKKTVKALFATGAAVALLSACTSATEATGSSGASTSGNATSGNAASGDAACTAAATELVDAAREPAPLLVPQSPLDLASVKGKNIWLIMVLTNQFTSATADGFKEAAAAAGVNATIFDGQGQTNKWNEGMAQAIAQKADAIALLGIEPALLSSSISDAAAAGIPVVNALSGDASAPVAKGVFSNISADYTADGASLAAWTLADSQCTSTTLFAQPTAIAIYQNMVDGAKAVYRDNCADDCTLNVQEIDLANAATDLPQKVQTALQRDRDTGYVLSGWDSGVTFIEPVVASINPDVKILGRDGIESSIKAIQSGTGQDVTVAAPPEAWLGWLMIDDAARAISKSAPSGIVIPTRLIDSTNVGSGVSDVSPNYTNFQSAFKDSWSAN